MDSVKNLHGTFYRYQKGESKYGFSKSIQRCCQVTLDECMGNFERKDICNASVNFSNPQPLYHNRAFAQILIPGLGIWSFIIKRELVVCLPTGQPQNIWYPCGFGLACAKNLKDWTRIVKIDSMYSYYGVVLFKQECFKVSADGNKRTTLSTRAVLLTFLCEWIIASSVMSLSIEA